MRNLIIIGNGFDLAHGLKTDYASFIADIENNFSKYSLPALDENLFLYNLIYLTLNNANWSDIECVYFDMLIHIDNTAPLKKKFKNMIDLPDYYGVNELNEDFQQVKQFLAKYLHEQEANFKINENYKSLFNYYEGRGGVVVLNFNYTNTVSKYLSEDTDIELIHIHGELDKDEESEDNPMIFGYAADDKESKRLLDENDSQFVRNIKKFNYLYTGNDGLLKQYLRSEMFDIFILGHSCGLSDKLILNQVLNSKNVRKIYPFYYKNRDGYFETMVNIDRLIDDYSKKENEEVVFHKLVAYPECFEMPQNCIVNGLVDFLESIRKEYNSALFLKNKVNLSRRMLTK